MEYVKKGINKKMKKDERKKTKRAIQSKGKQKTGKTTKCPAEAAKYISQLLELNKLQRVILLRLSKEV